MIHGVDRLLKLRDPQGCTTLHRSAAFGHTALVEYLLKNGADPNHINDVNETALFFAAKGGTCRCMRCCC